MKNQLELLELDMQSLSLWTLRSGQLQQVSYPESLQCLARHTPCLSHSLRRRSSRPKFF